MALEKLNLDIYNEYRDIIKRYMQLNPCTQEDKINTATVHILYAIRDINSQIDKYNSGKLDISIYYRMMIKTDFLISIIEILYKMFYEKKKIHENDRKEIWGELDYKSIQEFRLNRSLTLAHPLETTRYETYGFGHENDKWCQDIRTKNEVDKYLSSELKEADFVMEIMKKGNPSPDRKPICIKKDILSAAYIALAHLQNFTDIVASKITELTEKLKCTPIEADDKTCINDYIHALVKDIEKRYPEEIQKINYANDSEKVDCIVYQALEYLNCTFSNPMREEQFKAYKYEIEQAVYAYGSSIQNMDLEETHAHDKLSALLYPSYSTIFENADYQYEKIIDYLAISEERSIESALEKLKKYSYDGCRNVGVCTDEEWGAIQLFTLQDELNPYFEIDFDATDKELFLQFCTALYFANKSLITKGEIKT